MNSTAPRRKPKKLLSTIVKIAVSIALLYLVYTKVDVQDIARRLAGADMLYLVIAGVLLTLSQLLSSFRLQAVLRGSGYPLTYMSNLKLYFLGMFYNFFIPGGIGGDAYKVYALNYHFKWKVKQLIRLFVADRLFGVFAIACIVGVMGLFLPLLDVSFVLRAGLSIVFTIVFVLVARWFMQLFFKSYLPIFNKAFGLSVVLQLLQVLCALAILKSLGVAASAYLVYSVVFLITSVLSVFSFSGIGVREYILLQASVLFSLDVDAAVTLGAIFSVLSALISLPGMYYHFKKPVLTLEEA